ncbi:DNA replication complex GINS protein PSF1-like [Tachypleus tridentatus]|uniref:DNA replication complex GINS protein PSF1-like n=1 Tax=Tachypleus tridentatus TaxID=6853 RepID=UPI003FCEF2AB
MLGEKALELIKEVKRSQDSLPMLKEDAIKQVLEEMKALFAENQRDVTASVNEEIQLHTTVQLRHSVLLRNKRCLLTYLFTRLMYLKKLRWAFGSILPSDVRSNLSESEYHWFMSYNKALATYMSSIGDGMGIDLQQHLQPPKSFYIQVRCLQDFGDFETAEGTKVVLTKNSIHLMQRSQCEKLIHQGILEHITI